MTERAQWTPRVSSGTGVRGGMGAVDLIERFARLNGLDEREVHAQLDGLATAYPTLRAHAVATRLAAEASRDGLSAEVFFGRWAQLHGVIAHPGVTWSRVRGPQSHPRLALTLAAAARVRTRAALLRLDADLRRVADALADDDGAAVLAGFSTGARAFAHPAQPRVLAGVHLSPERAWRWVEMERIAALLQRHGLRARFGLFEDQCSSSTRFPLVIWNPTLTPLPMTGVAVAEVELRVVGRA
ncbi:hypothetical protein ACIPVB_06515 [Microbacterium sp. NPDC090007]|uniref:hypothetical protein n=1 Tax=Microbacterium sp. NPDC090007 TaxID=3364204 RepID=UPI00381700EF